MFCNSKVGNIIILLLRKKKRLPTKKSIVRDYTTHSDKKLPDGVVRKDQPVCEGDFEWTILFGPVIWPVLLTLMLSPLHSIGYHGNHMYLFLPHQPPEVSNSVWEGTYRIQNLSSD